MKYYLYEIKNLLNGKIYLGVHSTNDMNDGYMGSGSALRKDVGKFGLEQFSKTILETFTNSEEMYLREEKIVNIDFLKRDDVYNIRIGGKGGFDHINSNEESIKKRIDNRTSESFMKMSEGGRKGGNNVSAEKRLQSSIAGGKSFFAKYGNPFAKIQHTPEFKQRHKEALRAIEHQVGSKNSQFGTMWITTGLENKKIKKDFPIPEGWRKGRTKPV